MKTTQLHFVKYNKIALWVSAGLMLAACSSAPTHLASGPAALPAKTGYFPLQIQNNVGQGASQNGVSHVYILFSAKQPQTPNPQCLMQLTQDTSVQGYNAWVGSCVPLSMQTQASQFSYSMDTLQATVGEPVIVYVPNVISGRAFVSLNYPLDVPITRAANGTASIQEPSLSNPFDGNYNLIFDKFEYTYDNTNTMWIDTTSVDDFALPIALSYTDPDTHVVTNNGYTGQDRTNIISGIQTILSTQGNSDWSHLVVTDAFSKTGTVMRIDAPNTSPSFNPNYLTALNGDGFNYINALRQYYTITGNNLMIDCSEVDASSYPEYVQLGSGTDPQAYIFKGSVVGNDFIFKNETTIAAHKMTVSIDLSKATSNDFFGPGQSPLDTPDGTIRSVLVKNLTSAFSVGLLPAPTGVTLNSLFSRAHTNYYTENTILKNKYNAYTQNGTGIGPWYDLYADAIHQTAANSVYAFAFDDVLKQDGTISVHNTGGAYASTPIIITLGSVDHLVVPEPGPNYTPNPHPNDVAPVTQVKQTGYHCSGNTCKLSVSWEIPSYQDSSVNYYILPLVPGVPLQDILPNEQLVPYGATSMSASFTMNAPPSAINQVAVFACIPSPEVVSSGFDCPSNANGYTPGSGVVGASSPNTQVNFNPPTPTSNSFFKCNGTTCSLTASWSIPAGQPSGVKYYINPLGNPIPLSTFMTGQTFTNGTSSTLTVPQSDVTQQKAQILIMACMDSGDLYCPSSANGYLETMSKGSTPFPVN